jgi:hypothetical protein
MRTSGGRERYSEIQGDLSWENPGRHRQNNERWRMEDPMVTQGETWIWNGKSGRDIGRFVGKFRNVCSKYERGDPNEI